MAMKVDSRIQARRDVGLSFASIQAYTSQVTYYNPSVAAQANYIGQKLALPRRWSAEKDPLSSGLVWRACTPKVGNNGPRTEASLGYEAATVTRFFLWDFLLPASGSDAWASDVLSFCVIGQWHEYNQPHGGRPPPFEIDVYEDGGGVRLRLVISEDGGTGDSGTVTPPTAHTYELGYITRGTKYRIGVQARAEGLAGDFLKLWFQGVQAVDYSGFVGFPSWNGQSVYDQQVFFKFGVYNYFANASVPTSRVAYHYGCLVGDETETYASMVAYYDAVIADTAHIHSRWIVAVLGGTNVLGNTGSGVVHRSLGGAPCQDPVTPATVAQSSLVPALANRLSERRYGAYAFNCASAGANITSYVGQCRGAYATGTAYAAGDSVTPPSPTGVDVNLIPLGLKYIAINSGTSGGSPPTFPTTEHATVADNGITWIAERRESYDTAAHTYAPGELGFDPLGLLSQAVLCVSQTPAPDRKILLLMPSLDTQISSATTATAAISAWASTFGIEVITSTQTAQDSPNQPDDYSLTLLGRAAANEL